jgi:hypothetical protein
VLFNGAKCRLSEDTLVNLMGLEATIRVVAFLNEGGTAVVFILTPDSQQYVIRTGSSAVAK